MKLFIGRRHMQAFHFLDYGGLIQLQRLPHLAGGLVAPQRLGQNAPLKFLHGLLQGDDLLQLIGFGFRLGGLAGSADSLLNSSRRRIWDASMNS